MELVGLVEAAGFDLARSGVLYEMQKLLRRMWWFRGSKRDVEEY